MDAKRLKTLFQKTSFLENIILEELDHLAVQAHHKCKTHRYGVIAAEDNVFWCGMGTRSGGDGAGIGRVHIGCPQGQMQQCAFRCIFAGRPRAAGEDF